MSVEKQGTVKSELSPDGGLKLTIKREKTAAEDACKREWVTEARGGSGLSKLVIKRKSPGSVSRSPKTTGLHVDRRTEQQPILRLSLTSTALRDRNRHARVKSWSSCEVSSAVEEVASASELSPTCPLQQSPKDSGIDMSSPPHDDGAVGVEPSSGTGMWSSTDSSAVETEKMTSCLEKLETTITNFVHANNAEHSSSKALWPDTMPRSCESKQHNVQSTLRSRGERSVLKSLSSTTQKLVNPLAKPCRVGRYQHMLPVNRIRSEANVARRSSLEESPTYNMVTSRTSLCSSLPRVKTKLKLMSNNTYAPVFDEEMPRNEQHAVDQNSKCLSVKKSTSEAVECRRNRISYKSSASTKFENLKVKFSFNNKNHRHSLGDTVQKLPKLKLVVKSEPALSISCIEQRLEDASITAADKQVEENIPRHVKQKQRQHQTGKTKARNSSASATSPTDADCFSAKRLSSLVTADIKSCNTKRKSLKAKEVGDWEPSGKTSKVQSSAEQLSCDPPKLSDPQHLFEEDCINSTGTTSTVQSVYCEASADESVCSRMMSLSPIHTDELGALRSSVNDVTSNAHAAVQLESRKSESDSVDQTKSSALLAESDYTGTGAIHTNSVQIEYEKHCEEVCDFLSERCTASDIWNANADHDADGMDLQHAEQLPLPNDSVFDVKEDMPTLEEHDSTYCTTTCDEVLVPDKPCAIISSGSADDRLAVDTTSDQSEKNIDTCAVFQDISTSCTFEDHTTECTASINPLLSSPELDSGDLDTQNLNCSNLLPDSNGKDQTAEYTTTVNPLLSSRTLDSGDSDTQSTICCRLLADSNGSDVGEAEDTSLLLTLNPAVVTDNALSCATDVVNSICPVDLVKLDSQVTECQHDVKQEMVDNKELFQKNFECKSVCAISDKVLKLDNGCEQIVNNSAYLFDVPSLLMPLSPHSSKEQKETPAANSACSNGFLAAFTQFVKKVSAKKKSARYKGICDTASTSESIDQIPLKPASSQKCVRQKSFPSQRRRSTGAGKQTAVENRLPHCVAYEQNINTVKCVSGKEASSPDRGSLDDIECLLPLAAAEDDHSTLCREELLNVVASHCQLVSLRRRVCELIETLLPDFQFPPVFRRDSASVERLVQDVIDILSDSAAHTHDVQRCSDPVVTLHHMPDSCLQSLQRQVIQLLSLLLPVTNLSDINTDSLDVFLELVTSVNRPMSGTACASQPNIHLSNETSLQPLSMLQLQGQLLLPCPSDTDSKQIDTSLSRPEDHSSAIDTLFNMPSSLLQINSSGPVGDKRSIRRQVKDCLMFLDRDLT